MNQIGKGSSNTLGHDIQLQCSEALNTVNINVVSPELEQAKPKKMGSNRRRKQKLRQRKQQSRQVLHQIIKSMCSLKTNFEENQNIIDSLLQVDLDEDRFYQFISKVTREEMDILAQQIHGLTANFCFHYKEDDAINPAEIARLFELIQIVKQASVQIEKIINFFIRKTEHSDVEAYLHKNLELSTLKYIIESDPLKEDFEIFCHSFIIRTLDKRQKIIIDEILNRIKNALEFQQESQQCYQCYDEMETKQTEQQVPQVTETQENKKKKKKKKNKNKQLKQTQSTNREIQIYAEVVKNLRQLTIWEGERQTCYIDEQWMSKLKSRLDDQAKQTTKKCEKILYF